MSKIIELFKVWNCVKFTLINTVISMILTLYFTVKGKWKPIKNINKDHKNNEFIRQEKRHL